MKRGQENMQKTVLTNSLESANAGKTREEVKKLMAKQNKAFDVAMRTLKSKSYDELKKEGNLAFGSKALEEVSIVIAYQEKKLKSKKMVKRAKSLVAAAERKQAKENKKESVRTDER